MTRTALGVLALDAVLIAVGYALLSVWLRGMPLRRWASYAGVALLTGAAASAVTLEIAAVAGFRVDLRTFAVLSILLTLAGVGARLAFRPAPAGDGGRAGPLDLPTVVLATLLTALACGLVVAGFRSTPWLDDSWGFWLPKGIVLERLGLDPDTFGAIVNPDYPIGWASLLGLATRLAGHLDVRAVNGLLATFAVGFLAAAARLLWGWVRPPFLLGGLLLVAVSPEFLRQSLGGGADIPVACLAVAFAVAGCRWIVAGDSLSLFLTAVFAADALSIKNEGVQELVVLAVGVGGLAALRHSWRRLALFAGACGAAALTAVPWAVWKHVHDVPSTVSLTHALSPSYLSDRTERLSPALSALTAHLTTGHEWLALVPLAVVVSLAAAALTRSPVYLLPAGVLALDFLALLWVYWADREEIGGLLFTSSYRTLDTMPILAGLVLAVTADAIAVVCRSRDATRRAVGRASASVMALPPWLVLAILLACQWLVVGIVAATARHNGWSYYSGGDDTWYYTSGWVLGHGHVPYASIGYGYPILLAPLAAVAGASLLSGLPLVVALNMLVLWPVALLCVYGIARGIAGRGYAYLATLVWIAFPLLSIPYFYERYHVKLIDQTLPSALGLVATADFPSMVLLLVAAYFALRAVTHGGRGEALAAGLAAGFALTIKPANLLFVPAPLAALAVARRPREVLLFAAGLVPAVAGLALWKYRGLGTIPAFSASSVALAAGTAPVGSVSLHRYLPLDWSHLRVNYFFVREYTWSLRMITWVIVAGVIALWRRSAPVAVLLGGWLACFIFLKASAPEVNVRDGSFFRYMIPAFPPFFFGLVALPLLVPIFGRRLAAVGARAGFWPSSRRAWKVVLAVAAAALAVPVLAIAALRPLATPAATRVPNIDQYVPANTFPLVATARPGGEVVLRWPSRAASGARAGYTIFRSPSDGLVCTLHAHSAASCNFFSDPARIELIPLDRTAATSYRDTPGPGTWVYRVAATVAPSGPRYPGNFFELSKPATVQAGA